MSARVVIVPGSWVLECFAVATLALNFFIVILVVLVSLIGYRKSYPYAAHLQMSRRLLSPGCVARTESKARSMPRIGNGLRQTNSEENALNGEARSDAP